MFFSSNEYRRSGFEIFMETLVVFYEYKVVKIDELVRKANLSSVWRNEIIDFLLVNNYVSLLDNKLLVLTPSGEKMVNEIVYNYRKSKDFYLENYRRC